jgi:D-tyrosyl-tRNA(Tyr) deacylase
VIALVQRVAEAKVTVGGETVGAIGRGILALIGVERGDSEAEAERLVQKIISFRMFEDDAGKMNRSLTDIGGELLAVPQFTLAADTNSGTRASFSAAAAPPDAERLFSYLVQILKPKSRVATGVFGADMKVSLVNDGPVTFWLQVAPQSSSLQNKS